ncbi:MAG: CoB--CoM heterodisulfide reductase iron-sulfur subunit A family protein [Thermoplasmata archaeon]|nr:MAG: CoB--CoM heterodisulfide reductase iron-sulfur subunit A family protein [Thermoplasmata archaeon]
MSDSVVVIGGGIAGVQAALDLANSKVHVYLVEKTPSLGGRMAQLDKTFPTNDCSMCILSPKLVEVQRHPNIDILTNSEVTECKGSAANFKVKILKHARYVDEDKCTGCGTCTEKCPKKIPSEFEMEIAERKAIYVPFPQSVPLYYTIDKDNCIYFEKGKCRLCEKNCAASAVNFDQKDEELTINAGSIIVATGYDIYSPSLMSEYNYGKFADVISALEFERLMSASGPTEGRIFRPSDDKIPKSITFIQCAGSRDVNHRPYCSRVCCMYAIKEAMLAKEHESEISDVNILYMDLRTFGKGFEEYYIRARDEEGVNFIRGRVSEILQSEAKKNLIVRFEDTESGKIEELKTDMVILPSALVPSKGTSELAGVLGIELDDNGFIMERDIASDPITTSKDGIFACGCIQGPKDIPDSVSQAQAASAKALEFIRERLEPNVVIEETARDEEKEETLPGEQTPRVGVFVCNCGINIGGTVDVKGVAEFAKGLPNVVFADDNLFTCSEGTQQSIQEAIREHDLNRVVVAACTPRTHETLFRKTCSDADLNPYLFDMANIREHCSWVHSHEKGSATSKAKQLVEMAVARAAELTPLTPKIVDIEQQALVIGGGISGIQAALEISRQGIPTHLVERTEKLGGRLLELDIISPSKRSGKEILKEKLEELKSSEVTIHTDCEISDIDGFVGNFSVELSKKGKKSSIEVGAIVLAIGSDVMDPKGRYSYEKHDNVITNLELENLLSDMDPTNCKENKEYVYILCVGAREKEGNTWCSRYCCQVGIKQALELAKVGNSVAVLYRDIRTFGKNAEEMYKEASEAGVRFVEYTEDRPPVIGKGGKSVSVYDALLEGELKFRSDYIVLGVPMISPSDAQKFQEMLKIPRGNDGFFMELHPKLAPLQTNMEGVFLCGCAQGPKNLADTMAQASGAASQAIALLSNNRCEVEAAVAHVNSELCWGCGTCIDICEFKAPQPVEIEGDKQVSQINEALCKGCGMCAVHCPSGALVPQHFTREQILSMIEAFGSGNSA